ncbi:MAG: osmoprotectant ABC transporter substrate-binding protein [Peptoniphilaceae bacterium]|nr:osmoprotectant ABC transporter substrate-binding protein [Peptoniphilaceae bacterium]MDY6085903.1 osmoprotectant ABC transporter substrate-binding protein [Peptoniphilaceae bacterium]
MRKKRYHVGLFVLLLVMLCGCELPGLGATDAGGGIVIAGGNTTERQILAEINAQMIRHYLPEEKTNIINNLGSTILIHQTLLGGQSNFSGVMYTGTSLTGEVGAPPTKDPEEAMVTVQKAYDERFHAKWYPSYGFENTYAFMVTREMANEHHLQKVSDLAPIAQDLNLGADTAWMEREGDGYKAFLETYDFTFKDVYPMEIGLVYSALQNHEMDVVLGYTTDGRISSYDLVVLEDDLKLFPPYEASPVVMNDLLQEKPALDWVVSKLIGQISTETMSNLNRLSDEEMIEPHVVAERFLTEHDYFEDVNRDQRPAELDAAQGEPTQAPRPQTSGMTLTRALEGQAVERLIYDPAQDQKGGK